MIRPHCRNRCRLSSLPFLGLLVMVQAAHAQSGGAFAVISSTVDGGGGSSLSEDGRFSVTGTIGQPDAGVLSDSTGAIELTGGFWGGRAITVPALSLLAAVALTIATARHGRRRLRRRKRVAAQTIPQGA